MVSVIGRALLVAAACAALLGCGGTASAERGRRPARVIPPVDFTKSGGFAPVLERLHIARNGRAALRTGFPGSVETTRFRLARSRLASLRSGFAAAGLAGIGAAGPTSCADCFEYRITYRGHTVDRAETDVPKRLEPVITQLTAIVDSHLPR